MIDRPLRYPSTIYFQFARLWASIGILFAASAIIVGAVFTWFGSFPTGLWVQIGFAAYSYHAARDWQRIAAIRRLMEKQVEK